METAAIVRMRVREVVLAGDSSSVALSSEDASQPAGAISWTNVPEAFASKFKVDHFVNISAENGNGNPVG